MKYIVKHVAPASLEAYKATEGACYNNMPQNIKKEVRQSLVSEQGGICCIVVSGFNRIIIQLLNIFTLKV